MKHCTAAVLATLASFVSATPYFTNTDFSITAGQPFVLTWANAVGPVTIVLATGPASNLVKVQTIDSENAGDSFTWTPPTDVASGTYAFEITDSTGTNYSKQFSLTGTGTASTSGTSSTTVTTTSGSTTSGSTTSSSLTSTTTGISTNSTTSLSSTMNASKTSNSSITGPRATSTTPANTNDGPMDKSPLAFVLLTVAALMYFN